MMMNKLPHAITVAGVVYEPIGEPFRLEPDDGLTLSFTRDDVPIVTAPTYRASVRAITSQIFDLTARAATDTVIVSRMVLDALEIPEVLHYVAAPDTGPESAIRDENGQIIGVRRLVMRWSPNDTWWDKYVTSRRSQGQIL